MEEHTESSGPSSRLDQPVTLRVLLVSVGAAVLIAAAVGFGVAVIGVKQGDQGPVGDTGPQGLVGEQGSPGQDASKVGPRGPRGERGPSGPRGPTGEVDEQAVFDAINSDPDQVNEAINGASAPTANSICDALQLEGISNDSLNSVYLQGC